MRSVQWRKRRLFWCYYAALGIWLATTAMHIPDGYLSPVTCALMFLLVLPFWARGVRSLREKMSARTAPVVALVAAFSFVIMMFNIPLPGGTSGHVVGASLAAVLLGPEIASIAISTALVIQALFFGDGGILSLGANAFNMAVVLPYLAYAVYRLTEGGSAPASRRRVIGAALGGWVGMTAAALAAGVEFGLQPLLFHTANGAPLYAPFPLAVAVPAMVIPHALVASVAEGLVTGLVVVYLRGVKFPALQQLGLAEPTPTGRSLNARLWRKVWIGLIVMAVAVPLGLLAPGTAWGEWNIKELSRMGQAITPEGMARLGQLWKAPLANYNLPAVGSASLGYILSALAGLALCALLIWAFTYLLARRKKSSAGEPSGARARLHSHPGD